MKNKNKVRRETLKYNNILLRLHDGALYTMFFTLIRSIIIALMGGLSSFFNSSFRLVVAIVSLVVSVVNQLWGGGGDIP